MFVQDLASSKGQFARNADGGAAAYFRAAKDPVTRQLASRGVIVPKPEPNPKLTSCVQDLASSKGQFARNADGGAAAYFRAAKDPIARQLASRGVVVGTPEEGVELVRAGSVNAYITEIGILKYYASLARLLMHASDNQTHLKP